MKINVERMLEISQADSGEMSESLQGLLSGFGVSRYQFQRFMELFCDGVSWMNDNNQYPDIDAKTNFFFVAKVNDNYEAPVIYEPGLNQIVIPMEHIFKCVDNLDSQFLYNNSHLHENVPMDDNIRLQGVIFASQAMLYNADKQKYEEEIEKDGLKSFLKPVVEKACSELMQNMSEDKRKWVDMVSKGKINPAFVNLN